MTNITSGVYAQGSFGLCKIRLHIQDIERMLYIADYGMGMPRDPERVKELRTALEAAHKEAFAAEILAAVAEAEAEGELEKMLSELESDAEANAAAIAKAEGTS